MSELTAYEKMLQDGTAFKKIDMSKITAQEYAGAGMAAAGGGKGVSTPLGEPEMPKNITESEYEVESDWSAVDAAMEKRVNALREKMSGGSTNTKQPLNESQEITKLKSRVKRLEDALIVIMETQEKLLG